MRILLLILGFTLGFVSVNLYLQTLKVRVSEDRVTELQLKVDSLQADLFNEQTINGRYELSLEHLKEINPKAAKQFTDYLENQTE